MLINLRFYKKRLKQLVDLINKNGHEKLLPTLDIDLLLAILNSHRVADSARVKRIVGFSPFEGFRVPG